MKERTVEQSASDDKVQSVLINLPKLMRAKIPKRGKKCLGGIIYAETRRTAEKGGFPTIFLKN